MELLFLGTSSGTPTKEQNVSSVAIKKKNNKSWYLIDCGEGTQHQILKTKLSLVHLKAICITHIHGDHCYGLPGLLASASMDCRKDKLTIIAPKAIKLFLNNVFETTLLDLSFDIDFIEIEQVLEPIVQDDFDIGIVELSHRCPSYAFNFTEKNIKPTLNSGKLLSEGISPSAIWCNVPIYTLLTPPKDSEYF